MESLSIDGAWAFTPQIHRDDRGSFHELFRGGDFADTFGYPISIGEGHLLDIPPRSHPRHPLR